MDAGIEQFAPWLALWDLIPEGEPLLMPHTGSRLLPVRRGDTAAMLKLAASEDERRGGQIMAWWDGEGAAPVLARRDEALLMLRAAGRTLTDVVLGGDDRAATATACEVLAALHRPRPDPPQTRPLAHLFSALLESGEARLDGARSTARHLLEGQAELRLLHGDMHHGNVLDFGPRGWLAIDPWGVAGERAYDYANLFRNPRVEDICPERFGARLAQISALANLEPARLQSWAYAHAGLSAAWDIQDGALVEAERSFALISLLEGRA